MDAEVQKKLKDGYKRCSTCKRTKPLSDFNYRRDTPDNKQYHCAACGIKRNAKYYAERPQEAIDRRAARDERKAEQTPGCPAFAEYAYGFYKNEGKLLYLKDGIPREVDHIVSIADGGYHHIDNFQLLTKSENRRKGADSWSPDDPRLKPNKAFQELIKRRWLQEDRCRCEHCQAMARDIIETRERRRARQRERMEDRLG
ncbi:MAG: HNH endonuclease [Pseudomonadales bacterium]|nr:HNH endonuclease [Pseudomonadales bacterium]